MAMVRPTEGSAESRVLTIDDQRVRVFERKPPLPARLDALLERMQIGRRFDVRPTGTRLLCETEQDHRLAPFAEGRHVGSDGLVRDLRLLMCLDCTAVCVRDVSIDRDTTYDPAGGFARRPRQPWRRRDLVLGWYSGARRSQREYR